MFSRNEMGRKEFSNSKPFGDDGKGQLGEECVEGDSGRGEARLATKLNRIEGKGRLAHT